MPLLQLIKMVLWGFFGVRKRAALEHDAVTAKPAQVIAVAILMAAAIVFGLLAVVKTAISSLA